MKKGVFLPRITKEALLEAPRTKINGLQRLLHS
jgi:hypothetical protein